jgi:hypothetical protein
MFGSLTISVTSVHAVPCIAWLTLFVALRGLAVLGNIAHATHKSRIK